MKKFLLTLIVLFLTIDISYSQWTSNTAANTSISSLTGDQATPKIASTSDGGCYITWFDQRVAPYAVYLQRLNKYGFPQFAANGLLISSNPQSSSLQDFNIDVDANDNAVIVFTDQRNGSTLNPFAYLISPSGSFLWGPNGVGLSDSNSIPQSIPIVTVTSDNNYVFGWSYGGIAPFRIALQKLDISGTPQWGAAPIKLRGVGTENYNYMRMVKSDAGSVIMSWDVYTGNITTTGTVKLLTQKFSSSGTKLWALPQDTVQNIGKMAGISFIQSIVSDGNNGAIYTWVDDRDANNRQSTWVQHYNSSGVAYFPKNGSEVSTLSTNIHLLPTSTYCPSSGEIFTFWTETNGLGTVVGGLYGQKFNSAGVQLWASSGKEFKGLDNNQLSFLNATAKDTNVVVTYTESIGLGNALVKAMSTGPSGEFHWPGNIVTTSSSAGGKIRKQATMDKNSGMSVMTWSNGDIPAQNINLDGSLGIITLDATFGIQAMWNGTTQVQDTVRFYLRSSTAPYNAIDSSVVFLNGLGQGTAYLAAPNGSYYIQTIHRSALETWSSSPVAMVNGTTVIYDFTTAQSQTYGNNSVLTIGRYSSYSGEVTKDGAIDLSDIIDVYNKAQAFTTGYVAADVNGDNVVDLSDLLTTYNNAIIFVQVSKP